MSLQNKVVIITGASRGIGRATAVRFGREGSRVAVSARDLSELQSLVSEIESSGGKAVAVKVDVTKKADVDRMVAETVKHFGTVDLLVNNAGVGIYGEVAEITEQDFDTMVGVNFKGVFLATKAVLPVMMKKKSGHIINVSSTSGKRPFPKMAVYCGTKSALTGFCKTLAKEVKPYNIRVSIIYPGMVDTYFRDKMTNRPEYTPEERGRMMTSDDIARAIVFMADQEQSTMIDELELNAPMF